MSQNRLILPDNIQEFSTYLDQILAPQEALYNLILGLLRRAAKTNEKPLIFQYHAQEIELFGLQTRSRPLILASHVKPKKTTGLMTDLAHLLHEKNLHFNQVVAPRPMAYAFAKAYHPQVNPDIIMEQGVYRLYKVHPSPNNIAGFFCPAGQEDFETVLKWYQAFVRESLPHQFNPLDNFSSAVQSRIQNQQIYLWKRHNRPLSMAAKTRETHHGTTISLVYTPPDNRGNGYASACVAALSQVILDQGKDFCSLFTDLSNPASNKIYQRIGYEKIGDFAHLSWIPT